MAEEVGEVGTPKVSPQAVNTDAEGAPSAPATPVTSSKKPASKVPKTPVKAKSKAVAKGSPKASPTAKAKSVLKKPKALKKPAAAAASQGKEKSKSLKRPASKLHAKAGSKKAKSSTDEGNQDMEDPEEEKDFEQDTEVDFPEDEGKKTDRCKKQKFLQMVSNKELPEYILKESERSKGLKSGRTEVQRNLINSISDRTSAGRLLLSLANPQFESLKQSYKDTCAIQSNRALSKTLFMGNLTKELFEEGLESGGFFENRDDDGKLTYSWVEKNQETRVGDRSQFGSKASLQVSSKDALNLHNMSNSWKQGLFKTIGSSRPAPQPIMDATAPLTQMHWRDDCLQLEESMVAFDKCEKEALKYLQLIGVESTGDTLHAKLPLGCIFSNP